MIVPTMDTAESISKRKRTSFREVRKSHTFAVQSVPSVFVVFTGSSIDIKNSLSQKKNPPCFPKAMMTHKAGHCTLPAHGNESLSTR